LAWTAASAFAAASCAALLSFFVAIFTLLFFGWQWIVFDPVWRSLTEL
jgi:hypothetical protein